LDLGGRVDKLSRAITHADMGKGVLKVPWEWNGYSDQRSIISNYRIEAEAIKNNINVASFRPSSFLKVDRLTGRRLQGGFTKCLGQRWLRSN
jgi:hypothetical protein